MHESGRSRVTVVALLGFLIVVAAVLFQVLSGASTASGPSFAFQVIVPTVTKNVPQAPPITTPTPAPTPTSTPTPTPSPIPRPLAPRLGVQFGPGDAATVDLLKGTGAKLTRVTFYWSSVERSYTDPATYDFSSVESLLRDIGSAGITTILEIRSAPSWASSRECGPTYTSDGRAAFARLLGALAQRYSVPPYNVKNWELFNEPDSMVPEVAIPGGLGCWAIAPTEYVEILRIASTSIKAVDPDAKIWLGGMAHEGPPAFDNDFLDKVLASGGASYFDIANVHYYSSQNDGTFHWYQYGGTIQDIAGKVGDIRRRLAQYGVTKPVAVTEMSWTSSPVGASDLAEKQARYVAKVLARGANMLVDLYGMTWFTLTDYRGTDYAYGLTDVAGQPRPSYRAFQVATAEFGSATLLWMLDPRQVGVTGGVEGYVYVVDGQERWVLWARAANDPNAPAQASIVLPSRAALATDKLGAPITLAGANQSTTFALDDSPIFVHLNP